MRGLLTVHVHSARCRNGCVLTRLDRVLTLPYLMRYGVPPSAQLVIPLPRQYVAPCSWHNRMMASWSSDGKGCILRASQFEVSKSKIGLKNDTHKWSRSRGKNKNGKVTPSRELLIAPIDDR